ncbi:MAG: AraC family transcriptional regulator [Longicatena sp.]
MKQQNDWYTGIDHHQNLREQDITITKMYIDQETKQKEHERVILIYVYEGKGEICINGVMYPLTKGSFCCLYMHHFYHYHHIKEPIIAIYIEFYIGLFMYMCWEKHPQHANAALMYDTVPLIQLEGSKQLKVEALVEDIYREEQEKRFNSLNMVTYQTLCLHSLHCRYAFEGIEEHQDHAQIWSIIVKIILATGKDIILEDMANELHLSSAYVNQKIKEACGYTFFQLQQWGKVVNACALLHYSELTMAYICDLLNYSSMEHFYRVFKQYTKMTPREYQYAYIEDKELVMYQASFGLQILQYIHLHYSEALTSENIANELQMKEYTLKEICIHLFHQSIKELIEETRITYAQSLLRSTNSAITSIVSSCGFDSLATFQRMMKKYTHQSASEYRKSFSNK